MAGRGGRVARWFAVPACLLAGCGTIGTRSDPDYDGPRVYSGTCMDVSIVYQSFAQLSEASIGALMIFDLPFSLVADTVLLPLTIYEQVSGRRYHSRADEEPDPGAPPDEVEGSHVGDDAP